MPNGKSLPVLQASILAYAPEHPLISLPSSGATFGESYNNAMRQAFEAYDEIIIANDDVVLTPYTMPDMLSDLARLKSEHGDKLGLVGTYADNIRWVQHIKGNEFICREIDRLSPLFTWMSKKAFMDCQFPPMNWYADDVICEDLSALGYRHFISKAYVHHVGSQTIGTDVAALNAASMPWLMENRPKYLEKWFGRAE
jgi:hypothetical protein